MPRLKLVREDGSDARIEDLMVAFSDIEIDDIKTHLVQVVFPDVGADEWKAADYTSELTLVLAYANHKRYAPHSRAFNIVQFDNAFARRMRERRAAEPLEVRRRRERTFDVTGGRHGR